MKTLATALLAAATLTACASADDAAPDIYECGAQQICEVLPDEDVTIDVDANVYTAPELTGNRRVTLLRDDSHPEGTTVRFRKLYDDGWRLYIFDELRQAIDDELCAFSETDVGWCEVTWQSNRWVYARHEGYDQPVPGQQ